MVSAPTGSTGKAGAGNRRTTKGRGVALADFIFEIIAQSKRPIDEALGYSVARLQQLAAAEARNEARRGLMGLAVVQAAVASCMAKNGASISTKVRRALEKQAKGIDENG